MVPAALATSSSGRWSPQSCTDYPAGERHVSTSTSAILSIDTPARNWRLMSIDQHRCAARRMSGDSRPHSRRRSPQSVRRVSRCQGGAIANALAGPERLDANDFGGDGHGGLQAQ